MTTRTGGTGTGGTGTDNPWRWRRRENPYRSTAFAVLGIDARPRRRREFVALVRRRAQRARFGTLRLFGQQLGESDVHAAAQRLRDPAGRLLEELRTHRPHPVRLDVAVAAAALDDLEPAPLPELRFDRAALARLVPPPRPRRFAPLRPTRDEGGS